MATGSKWRELRVTAEASEMGTAPRAEPDALRAEVRRLRREVTIWYIVAPYAISRV
jgi:hypothetical protein